MEAQLLQSVAAYKVDSANGGSIQQKEVQQRQSVAVYMVYTAEGGTTSAV